MRIGFDYVAILGRGGNGTYSRNLIDAVINFDRKKEYYLYAYVHDFFLGRLRKYKQQKNVHCRPVYFSAFGKRFLMPFTNLLSLIFFKFWVRFDKIDIFHFTNPVYFAIGAKNNIATVHDLSGIYDSSWVKKESVVFLKKRMREIIDNSAGIIAVSNYTKSDLIKNFSSSADKISVVYEGCDDNYYADSDHRYIEDKFKLKEYILYVGQLQPRKNIINMIIAYARLPVELKQKYNLAIVGSSRDRDYMEEINKTIVFYQLALYVKILGRLSDDDVRKLYSGARALVFLSFFEGFGLPVLESLKCGAPVIVSNRASLPEVAGNAGLLVDPEDIDAIAGAMEKIMTDDNFYGVLKKRCLIQASKFSWEKAAKETSAKYEEVLTRSLI